MTTTQWGLAVVLVALVCTSSAAQAPDPDPLFGRAVQAFESARPYEALDLLRQVEAQDPSYPGLQVLLGQVCLVTGQLRQAKVHFERVLGAEPANGHAAFLLGFSLFQASRYFEAVAALDRAHNLAPQNPHPLLYRGLARLKLGDPALARADLERARAQAPDDPAVRSALVEIDLAEGRFARAEAEVQALLEQAPADDELRSLYARLLFAAGRPKEAVPWLRQLSAERPNRSDVLYLLGQALVRSGERAAAQEVLSRFKSLKAREERIRVLEAAVATEPADHSARLELVRLLLDHGEEGSARLHLQELEKARPGDPQVETLLRAIAEPPAGRG